MKGKILCLAVVVIFLLSSTAPAMATPPVEIEINADMYLNSPSSAAGNFTVSGFIADAGAAYEEFFISDDTIHGVKTLSGANGTITIRFQAELAFDGPIGTATGTFVIVSGTGDYAKLHGIGTTTATLDMMSYHIVATYSGIAHID